MKSRTEPQPLTLEQWADMFPDGRESLARAMDKSRWSLWHFLRGAHRKRPHKLLSKFADVMRRRCKVRPPSVVEVHAAWKRSRDAFDAAGNGGAQ